MEASYEYPSFTIEPAFCPLEYAHNTSLLNNGGSAVLTSDDESIIEFYYGDDLEPLGQTQTVTVTATSTSRYAVSPATMRASSEFDLTFSNPCNNANFVTINDTP